MAINASRLNMYLNKDCTFQGSGIFQKEWTHESLAYKLQELGILKVSQNEKTDDLMIEFIKPQPTVPEMNLLMRETLGLNDSWLVIDPSKKGIRRLHGLCKSLIRWGLLKS